jgi:hypothetical protein
VSNIYLGEHTSAIARAKKVLLAAGFPWSTKKGRYQPFFNTQVVTPGVTITRVGYSDTVAVHVREGRVLNREDRRWIEVLAIATLREAGLPFDDRGWLECGATARKKAAANQAQGAL